MNDGSSLAIRVGKRLNGNHLDLATINWVVCRHRQSEDALGWGIAGFIHPVVKLVAQPVHPLQQSAS